MVDPRPRIPASNLLGSTSPATTCRASRLWCRSPRLASVRYLETLLQFARSGDAKALQEYVTNTGPTVSALLAAAVECADEDGRRFLIEAATREPLEPKRPSGWNDAHAAALVGDPMLLLRAQDRGADFEATSLSGTALTTAILFERLRFVRALLELDIDLRKPVMVRRARDLPTAMAGGAVASLRITPLSLALQTGQREMADVLLQHVELEPEHFGDALWSGDATLVAHVCDLLGKRVPALDSKLAGRIAGFKSLPEVPAATSEVLRVLAARNVPLGGLGERQWKSLARGGELELLQRGASHCGPPRRDEILACAAQCESDGCRRVLVDMARNQSTEDSSWNDAHIAALLDDVSMLASGRDDLNASSSQGAHGACFGPPLFVAIRLGHAAVVHRLIELGVDPRAETTLTRPDTVIMMNATPLAFAIRVGRMSVVDLLLAHDSITPRHLVDAVASGDAAMVLRVHEVLGGSCRLDSSLLLEAPTPAVVRALGEIGLDLTNVAAEVWTHWASRFFSWDEATHVASLGALFDAGVQPSAIGLFEVMRHHSLSMTQSMIDLFHTRGADLSRPVSRFQDEGSISELLFAGLPLALLQHLHGLGVPLRPQRVPPGSRDEKNKAKWLRQLGLLKELTLEDFTALRRPTPKEFRAWLATSAGLLGLRPDMTRAEVGAHLDLEGADLASGHFVLDFDAADTLVHVQLRYEELRAEEVDALLRVLEDHFGKGKGRGNRRTWKLPAGDIEYHMSNRAGWYVTMTRR
jgi:ankyrin repeat protein